MKTKLKTVYYCEYCNKRYFQKPIMVQHEIYCTKKPENFADCLSGCDNLVSFQHNGRTVDFYCEHFKKFVHTSAFENKNPRFYTSFRPFKNGEPQESERMPTKCAAKIDGCETPKEWEDMARMKEIY